jgi:hypothetical protein
VQQHLHPFYGRRKYSTAVADLVMDISTPRIHRRPNVPVVVRGTTIRRYICATKNRSRMGLFWCRMPALDSDTLEWVQ